MNTPAHVIFSLALMGRNNAGSYALAIVLGALFPDLIMILFYILETAAGTPEQIIWNDHYHLPFWQNIFDLFNSIPLVLLLMSIAYFSGKKTWLLFFGSMLIHCFLDFPVHHDDSHRHFFPFSDFRFQSPVSYWNPMYFGNYVLAIELSMFCIGGIYLWGVNTKHPSESLEMTKLRWVLLTTALVYAGYLYFVATYWVDS